MEKNPSDPGGSSEKQAANQFQPKENSLTTYVVGPDLVVRSIEELREILQSSDQSDQNAPDQNEFDD